MSEERRITDSPCWDAALVMGIIYTGLYALMLAGVLLLDIPSNNEKTVDLLVGAMTIIQTTIVTYFFGSSKNAENTQRLIAASKERTDTVLREVVSSMPPVQSLKAADVTVAASGDVTVNEGKS